MVVVRILNTASLGLYQMAYKIAMLPITEVADVIARVTFPIYAKISGDKVRLKKAFYKTIAATVLFSLPIIILFILFPREIVFVILGEKWLGVVGVFQILVFFGLARAVTSPALILLLALKRQDIVAKISMFTFILLAITIVPFVLNWGIIGAGISSVIASIIVLPFAYYSALKYFSIKNNEEN
jgi:O-antigen/teichoic acid export membrane protein